MKRCSRLPLPITLIGFEQWIYFFTVKIHKFAFLSPSLLLPLHSTHAQWRIHLSGETRCNRWYKFIFCYFLSVFSILFSELYTIYLTILHEAIYQLSSFAIRNDLLKGIWSVLSQTLQNSI